VVLKERAKEHRVKIFIGTSVESMESLADCVIVKGTSADGSVFTATSKYIVSADGVNGMLQKAAGFDFERTSVETNIMVTGELSLNADITIPAIIRNEKAVEIAVPLIKEHNQIRLAAWMASRPNIPVSTPFFLEEINGTLEAASGMDWKCYNFQMLYRFTNAAGTVTNYPKDRVFLGGAAHYHLPASGQGLNLGLQ